MTETQLEVLVKAIKTFGCDNQSDIAIEEMSELTKAIIKHRRYHTDETLANLREEIADVQIMIWQLMIQYGDSEHIMKSKIERLKKRIEEFKNESTEKQRATHFGTTQSVKARVRKRIR